MQNRTETNNQAAIRRMTEGSIAKHIIFFAIPLLWGNLLQQLYALADALIVGRILGNTALAAVSSSGNLIYLMISLFTGFSFGSGVVIAKYFGARDREHLQKAIHTSFAIGLIMGVVMTVVTVAFAPMILQLMRTPETVLPQSIVYFRTYFAGSVGFVMFNMEMAILQSLGDSKHPLYYLAFSSLSNIVLDYLFVKIIPMGVGGAALATVLAQSFAAVLCLRQLMRNPEECRLYLGRIRLDGALAGEIFSNGLPAGIQNSIIGLANTFVQANVNSFGEMAVAGSGMYWRIEGFAFVPVMCFAQAMATFIGQNLGAKRRDRAWRGAVFGAFASMGIAEVIGITVFLITPFVLPLFKSAPEAVAVAVAKSHVSPMFFFLLAFSHCMAGVFRGAERGTVPMLVMMIVWCFFRVAFISVTLRYIPRIEVIYWAYPLTWAISSLIFFVIFIRRKWLE